MDGGVTEEKDDSDLFARLQQMYRDARDGSAAWREKAEEDYAFYCGNQWSDNDKRQLRDQLRPVVTFNRTAPIVDSVSGSEVNNRQETQYIPREIGDVKKNEILTAAAKFFREECNAEDEESDTFVDALICGMGWTETRLDYEENPEGNAVIERVDPLEMYWDVSARRRNLADGRCVFRVREIIKEDAEAMFPDADPDDLHADWADQQQAEEHERIVPDQYASGASLENGNRRRKVRLVEAQWWDREPYYRVADPMTGQATDMAPDQYKVAEERMTALGLPVKAAKLTRRVYKRAFLGKRLLEVGPTPCPTHFSYQCITGRRDRNKNTWYGLVRPMKDPQRWANKWLSQTLHIINSNAKGGLLAESDAFVNPRKAQEEWASPDSITLLTPGGLQKVQYKPAITYPAGLDKLMEFAISSIRDVTGVNLEMLGMADREQAGVLEYQRRQSAVTILAGFFDALRLYRKEQGRILLYYIQNYLSNGRLIRMVGDRQAQYVPLVREQGVAEYDVVVDEAPSSPNQKEQVFGVLQQILPAMMKMGITPPLDVLDYLPLPSSLTEAWKQQIQQQQEAAAAQAQQPDPAVQKVQAEIERENVKAQNDMQIKQAEFQMKAAQHQMDMEGRQMDMAGRVMDQQQRREDNDRRDA